MFNQRGNNAKRARLLMRSAQQVSHDLMHLSNAKRSSAQALTANYPVSNII